MNEKKDNLREQLIAKGIIKPASEFLYEASTINSNSELLDERLARATDRLHKENKIANQLAKKPNGSLNKESKIENQPTKKPNASLKTGKKKNKSKNARIIFLNPCKRYQCYICKKWIPLGEGLKHEAMHKGVEYVPSPLVSIPERTAPVLTYNSWVHVFQGGLPGLGKRHR